MSAANDKREIDELKRLLSSGKSRFRDVDDLEVYIRQSSETSSSSATDKPALEEKAGSDIADRPSVFISYSRRDGSNFAERLADALRQRQVNIWLDAESIKGGEAWGREIQDALERSRTVLAILTDGAITSKWTFNEWRYALDHGIRVIPILTPGFDPKQLPFMLSDIQAIDARRDINEAVEKLVPVLRQGG
jgi:hypothetical protein